MFGVFSFTFSADMVNNVTAWKNQFLLIIIYGLFVIEKNQHIVANCIKYICNRPGIPKQPATHLSMEHIRMNTTARGTAQQLVNRCILVAYASSKSKKKLRNTFQYDI